MRIRTLPLAFLIVAPLARSAQTPTAGPPRFRTGIEVINLSISVVDPLNRYVSDLGQSDFAVFEDGMRQELSLFTHENLPISLALMIDTSVSMKAKLPQAQAAALRFVRTLRPQDSAEVVQFGERSSVLQDFTSDAAALESAIRRTEASGATALYTALYLALKDLGGRKGAEQMRRRAIVLLSDGEDTVSLVSDEQVIELARQAEIAVYALSLQPDRPEDRERPGFRRAIHFLTRLARETGGQVHFPSSPSDLEHVYDRVAEELRTQYTLGYMSANVRRDGKWRRIVVRTPGRAELQVRHKIGYYAPRS